METSRVTSSVVGPRDTEVTRVTSRRDWADFLDLPAMIHRGDPNWVPPLRREIAAQLSPESSFLNYGTFQAFLARRRGRTIGRIVAAINHRLNESENKAIGLFGYFECIDDKAVAQSLLEVACTWLRGHGCIIARGPVNLSTHINCLLLVDGFGDAPYLRMPYNPRYYPALVEAAGWRKAKDAIAYDYPMVLDSEAAFARGYRHAKAMGVRFRPIRLDGKGFEADCRSLHRVYAESFSANWMATPRTEEEFLEEAKGLRKIVDPNLFPIAEHNGRMIGFWMALPDYNIALRRINGRLDAFGLAKMLWYRRKIDRARVLALGVLPEYQRGRWAVAPALIYLGMDGSAKGRKHYRRAELSWVWEDNKKSRSIIESSGGAHYKTYRLYERDLSML